MLLASYIEGNKEAFTQIVERYGEMLFLYLYRLVRNRHTSEDLLQETFIRVVQNLWRFSPERSFRAWIYSIATNLAYNELRKKKRKMQECHLEDWTAASASEENRLESLDRKETGEEISRCLNSLDEDHRVVFILRICENLSYEEIGIIVGCKPATARTRVFYTVEKIRKMLGESTTPA